MTTTNPRTAHQLDADILQDSASEWLAGRASLPTTIDGPLLFASEVSEARALAQTYEGRALVAAALLTEAHAIREWMGVPCSCGLFDECRGGAR